MNPRPIQPTAFGIVPILILLLAVSRAQGQELSPVTPGQSNVQNYRSSSQTNVPPSSDIPTPESYLRQQASGQDVHHQKMMQLLARKDYAGFEVEFEKKPEAGWAEALAWIYDGEGKSDLAKSWFSRALSLDASDASASYGLALMARNEGNLSEAKAQALHAPQDPKMRALLQQIYATEAGKSYDRKQYWKSLHFLGEAEFFGPLTADQRMLRAWTHYQLNEYAESAREFEVLYRVRHDKVSAEGLFYSLQRLDQMNRASALAQELGGPLQPLVRDQQARGYHDQGLFLDAEAASAGLYPALKNIDSPSLETGVAFRQKSGQSGLSWLRAERLPFGGGSVVFSGVNQLTVEASRLDLYSGPLASNAMVGTYPVAPRPYSFAPTTYLGDLTVLNLSFSHQGWFTPYLELGTTPIGGPVSVLPTGRLGFIQQVDSGNWGLSLYGKSNTESILSYAGIRDPYGGGASGRVVESGIEASGYQDLGSNWGFTGDGTLGVLTGDQVQTNEHGTLSVGVGKDLRLDGFQYFVLGPSFYGEHFEHNLSGFTVGQGGYFSPDYLAQGTLDLNFLTLEGQPYIVRARFGAGLQDNQQDASPLFPLSPDGRTTAATNQASYVLSADVEGVVRLGDHWQFGGALSYDKTADYTESKEMLFFRFLFEPRPAVFSSDLMKSWP
jgi:tetratricopeptide (TPR) repeat protein